MKLPASKIHSDTSIDAIQEFEQGWRKPKSRLMPVTCQSGVPPEKQNSNLRVGTNWVIGNQIVTPRRYHQQFSTTANWYGVIGVRENNNVPQRACMIQLCADPQYSQFGHVWDTSKRKHQSCWTTYLVKINAQGIAKPHN